MFEEKKEEKKTTTRRSYTRSSSKSSSKSTTTTKKKAKPKEKLYFAEYIGKQKHIKITPTRDVDKGFVVDRVRKKKKYPISEEMAHTLRQEPKEWRISIELK